MFYVYVFQRQKENKIFYGAVVKDKDENGNSIVQFLDVNFVGCNKPKYNGIIDILNGYLACYKGKDDTIRLKIVIKEWRTHRTEANDTPETASTEQQVASQPQPATIEEMPF